MKRIRQVTLWLIALVAVVGISAMMIEWYKDEMNVQMTKDGQNKVQIGGPFTLTNHLGQTVTDKDYSEKPMAIYFGYTFCPDVCPTTLADMTGWVEALGADANKINYLFITIDPERDDQESIKEYVTVFFDQLVGLTGSKEQVEAVAKAYRVYAKKVEDDDADSYVMDHTASVYLMKPGNQFMGTISYGEDHESALGKLKKLIAAGS
ncbi:SCO family protein [Cohaesibacter gelatinilyticus]|uniref:Protein SCO1/2 n=1 Tax=Cohaesibacter gelatinilyticus TaxID=372072 RepID=A0A285NA03_9HYPH|nr:SCO family protein [Cohaesibacter gelatinilyticus]SNZ06269.1 protein SCO1/2 [Cohaesibacter gelatinilyticus]HAT86437.1 SCO family protein [Hyphomicrobiales bacterium]